MISYEWTLETIEDGDIIDSDFSETLVWNTEDLKNNDLGVVRYEGDENKGITDKVWAYVKDGKLPDFFTDSSGKPIKIKVPQKFHKELKEFLKKQIA